MNFERIKKVKSSKPFTLLDIAVAAVIVAATVLCALIVYRLPAADVVISVNGELVGRYSLDGDTDIAIDHLTVHIHGGEAWVTDADCTDKTCEHIGKISGAWQNIVCLPNGVVISIDGGDDDLQWEIGR